VAEEITEVVFKTRQTYYDLDKEEFMILLKKSLTGHRIVFKNQKGERVQADQVNGQLMGSITSFPVLCIVNAGTNRLVLSDYQPLKNLKMSVNGDDIAFIGTDDQFQKHERLTRRINFILSDGKVFISKEFVNMNSRFFRREEAKDHEVLRLRDGVEKRVIMKRNFYPVEYASLGTIVPNRVDYDRSKDLGSMGQRYIDSVQRMPKAERVIHTLFCKKNKRALESVRVPWYIPSWLGGLGMTTSLTMEKISVLDRKITNKIFHNYNKTQPKNINNTEKIWVVWDKASEFLRETLPKGSITSTPVPNTEGERLFNEAMKFSCIQLLSDSNIDLKTLYKGKEKNSSSEGSQKPTMRVKDETFIRNLRYNEKIWAPSTYKNLDVTPVSNEQIIKGRMFSTIRELSDEERMAELILSYMEKPLDATRVYLKKTLQQHTQTHTQ
jgi:hypothetical protein